MKEGVISKDDYNFIIKNKIKYNPPSSARPNDNFLSIFDRDNEDCTSSHILYGLVDKSDPSITKKGDINSLNKFLNEWYDSASNKKSVSVFNNEDFYYFMICYYNNEHWDRQHVMLIDFPETDNDIEFGNLFDAFEAAKKIANKTLSQKEIDILARVAFNGNEVHNMESATYALSWVKNGESALRASQL